MARGGAGFRDILAHYYPNTTVTAIDPYNAGASAPLVLGHYLVEAQP
jgi:hypothetical protein